MPLKMESLLNDSIASPPSLYLKLQKALANPETTYEEFANIISMDTGFSFRLLKIANSPFFGTQEKIDSISQAISVLGTKNLADLTIATLVVDKFKGIPKDILVMNSFWKHSIGCGLIAQGIAKLKHYPDKERYYMSGLLHNIGSLLLFKEAPEKSRMLIAEAKQDQKSLYSVENQYLEFDHAMLGGALLKKWRLPEMYVEAATFHNDPNTAIQFPQIAFTVHLADALAGEMELGYSGDPTPPAHVPNALKALSLSDEDIEGIKKNVKEQFDQMVELFLYS